MWLRVYLRYKLAPRVTKTPILWQKFHFFEYFSAFVDK